MAPKLLSPLTLQSSVLSHKLLSLTTPIPEFLQSLHANMARLSLDVPEAVDSDTLAGFCNPESCVAPNIPADQLWEEGVNHKMHTFQGKSEEEMRSLVQQGPKGIEAFYNSRYFVAEQGLNEVMFESGIEQLNHAMKATGLMEMDPAYQTTENIIDSTHSASNTSPPPDIIDLTPESPPKITQFVHYSHAPRPEM
ncbi:hypothetical protein BDP27DRAFT_1419538 [Rhodocollybia butyracea]|uniref:Uncharacterized protein n=1 Tax=Rhodocollybia butyracea TaxID=206335 RepID=A0A9P5PYU6_9AGAR|nr:hypothetical protein BDP27DRAFT_1419538 [Rhodocollybia butyracea]